MSVSGGLNVLGSLIVSTSSASTDERPNEIISCSHEFHHSKKLSRLNERALLNELAFSKELSRPTTTEDRFIGVVDYKEFLSEDHDVSMFASGSDAEARYRRRLKTQMGLDGSGLLYFHGSYPSPGSRQDGDGGSTCCAYSGVLSREEEFLLSIEQQYSLQLDSMSGMHELSEVFHTPPPSPTRVAIRSTQTSSIAGTNGAPIMSSPKFIHAVPSDSCDSCHTPVAFSRLLVKGIHDARSSCTCGDTCSSPRSHSLRCETNWATPMTNANSLRTPVNGSKCNDVTCRCSTSPQLGCFGVHLSNSPRIRTPVKHESDLQSTSMCSRHTNIPCLSFTGSPVGRRNMLYHQPTAPHRHVETCDHAFYTGGLSLCDREGRPNISPLCWGHIGIVMALQHKVYLWQGPGKVYLIYEATDSNSLVSAVASSRKLTEAAEVYVAFAFIDGLTIIVKYQVGSASFTENEYLTTVKEVSFEKAVLTSFRDRMSHISTLQVVGHLLYTGCMDGVLTIRDLRNRSMIWRDFQSFMLQDLFTLPNVREDCHVVVGSSIYRLEVTPEGGHIAIGTSDSLLVYQTSHIAPGNRVKRRVVLTNSKQPVRAFCWWVFPFNSTNDFSHDSHHTISSGGGSTLSQTLLIYAGGADASVLSVYSIGSRCDRVAYRLSSPILCIVSSETSEDVLVSVDAPKTEERAATDTLHTEDRDSAGRRGREWEREREIDEAMTGVGDAFAYNAVRGADSHDTSSDEETLSSVQYVDHHHPVSLLRQTFANNVRAHGDVWRHTSSSLGLTARQLEHRVRAAGARPPLPSFNPPGTATHTKTELVQIFQLKDGGTRLERANGFIGLQYPSQYVALSPDSSLLTTTGGEMRGRIWRVFKPKSLRCDVRCDLR